MSKTNIVYKDVAPGAAEDAAVSTPHATPASNLSALPFVVQPPPIISGEWNAWGLTATYQAIDHQPLAFWSTQLSEGDCHFQNPPIITVDLDQQYNSTGLSLAFDTATEDYCTAVNLKWYQGGALKADADFYPDSAQYFCQKNVTSYDRVVLTLCKTKLPYRRAKLDGLLFGIHRLFDMTQIRKASVVSDMDPLSAQLPVSTLRWALDSREAVDFMFQLKQPVEVRNDDALLGVYYIDAHRRTAKNLYELDCYDAFGVLGESGFSGGVYTNHSAKQLLHKIVGARFSLSIEATDTMLTGMLRPSTKREAIQQVLFAWGVCASTDGRQSIRVFSPSQVQTEVSLGRVFPGISVDTAAVVTQVRVIAHTYSKDDSGGVEMDGVRYRDTETVYTVTNPNVTATDKENVVEVTGATLVSPAIGQATAQRVYDHHARRSRHKAKLVWRGEALGDCLSLPRPWEGRSTGNLVRMELTLSNTVVASCETVGV